MGDDYDPSVRGDTPRPMPDANPLDCEGHGSHVAGTTAGLGVTKAGATYTGGYATRHRPRHPGHRPRASRPAPSLYALKVFGCEGDTSVVGQALDWAADPNGDGDLSDHLDVVNMSLGSSYGSPDDPDAVASNNLAALGTVVVASIGNSGDVYEVGGSPGNATRVLAVAASDDGDDVVDGLKVDSPAGIEPADTVDGTQDNVFGGAEVGRLRLGHQARPDQHRRRHHRRLEPAAVGDTNNTDGCSTLSTADAAQGGRQDRHDQVVRRQRPPLRLGRTFGCGQGRRRGRRHLRQRRQLLLGRRDR